MLNNVTLQGRIPNFENAMKGFNQDDDKKAVASFKLDVKRNYKPQGEEFYPSDLLDCKAFGKTAQHILKYFSEGSEMIVQGEIRKGDNYEKDGQVVYGQLYVHVTSVYFTGTKDSNGGGSSTPKTQTATPARATNPLAGRRSVI